MKFGKVLEWMRWKWEYKVVKILGVVMGVFIMCFLFFFFWYLIISLCVDDCFYLLLFGLILFWIGYLNFCLNLIIYVYYNLEFWIVFKWFLYMCNLGGFFFSSLLVWNGFDGENNKVKYIVVNKELMLINV